MKIVMDTNVLVSGLLSPYGPPAEIVRMVSSGALTLCYDARILSEYRQVLIRPKFPFLEDSVDALLDQMRAGGILVVGAPLANRLPHVDDEAFLEVALAAEADCLVTGNLKHYPVRKRQGKSVLSPTDFLNRWFRRKK